MARQKKEKQYERKRRKYTFTLSDQAHEFLKNNVTNASRFVERLIEEAEKGIRGAYVTVSPIGVDSAGFEPAAFSLRTKRSTPDLRAQRCEGI